MSAADAVVLVWVAAWAVLGAGRGLVEQVLSLGGLGAGAIAGSRLAAALLPGGHESVWLPFVALAAAAVGALLAQSLLFLAAAPLRRRVQRGAARTIDRGGGLVLGAAVGLALAWLIAAAVVFQPSAWADGLREQVRRSAILREALSAVPPDRVLGALAQLDDYTLIQLPPAALPPPDPALAGGPVARSAQGAVVELRGRACGVIRQGSGWIAGTDLVATNAHVVAGQDDLQALVPGEPTRPARPVYVDAGNDVALVRVEDLGATPLPLGDAPRDVEDVVLMGYPGGGPLRAVAATAAPPRTVIAPDAYGDGSSPRSVVVTRGSLGPGSSGGPVIDRGGRVVAMIFGGSDDGASGAAVPAGAIRRALRAPHVPVDPGPCG